MAEPPDDVVDELYGSPLGEFVARRDARARELRKENRAVADAVKKLRKPSVSAAAVNQLSRGAPDDVEALLAAGEALRQAQLGGGDRDAIRAAAQDERDAVDRLAEQAAPGLSQSALEEVRETLHAAASDPDARELIRRGVLTEARQAVGLGGFGAAFAAAGAERVPAAKKGGKAKRGSGAGAKKRDSEAAAKRDAEADRKRAAKEREAEAAARRAAEERVKAARAALRDAERAATAAERDRADAQKALDRAERKAAAAREDVERRMRELEDQNPPGVGTSAP
jgi:hypothetical protein